MVGHNVSHSNIKTKRRFLPALSPATLQSDALGQSFRLRISNAALRTLDFKGGLDVFLVLIAPHGLLELTAIFVAAAAGLRVLGAIYPGRLDDA